MSLEDLLTRTLLTDADPYYDGSTVDALPVCGADDGERDQRRRVLVTPTASAVHFPLSRHVSATTTFLNADDTAYRRILTATGGFRYNREATQNGQTVSLGPAVAHLCRSDAPAAGRFEVFVSNNTIVQNTPPPGSPLRRINFEFRWEEIRAIVHSHILPNDHWRVAPDDHRRLDLTSDETEINLLLALINRPGFPATAARRAAILEAFRQFQRDLPHQGMDMQRDMQSRMIWLTIGGTLLGTLGGMYGMLLVGGKAGPIHSFLSSPFRGLYNFFRIPFDRGAGWSRFWNDATTGVRYRGIPTLLNIGTNMTEQARLGEFRPVADPTTPAVAAQIENTINSRHNTMSVLVEGPPGWGKEQIMRTLALRNPNTVYIQVTPNGMMGGTMYRGQLEQRLTDIPREIARARSQGRRVVLFVDEFHEALSAGKTQDSATSLLEHWKGALARGDIRIVGFSTPRELLKARFIAGVYNDPAAFNRLSPEFRAEVEQFRRDGVRQNLELRPLLNRFQPVLLPPRPASDIVAILQDQIAERRGSSGLNITMDDAALRRIAEMSESPLASEGHIPRTALAIFNGVIDAHMPSGSSSVTVDRGMIDGYVQANYPDISQRLSDAAVAPANQRAAASHFTATEFTAEFLHRFPAYDTPQMRPAADHLARMAHQQWDRAGAPLDAVGAVRLPPSSYVVEVERSFREALAVEAQQSEVHRERHEALSRMAVDNIRLDERGAERSSERFLEAGRRAAEIYRR